MSDDNTNNNNNEQLSVFSEQDKELAMKAEQEYEGGQFDGLYLIMKLFFNRIFIL